MQSDERTKKIKAICCGDVIPEVETANLDVSGKNGQSGRLIMIWNLIKAIFRVRSRIIRFDYFSRII